MYKYVSNDFTQETAQKELETGDPQQGQTQEFMRIVCLDQGQPCRESSSSCCLRRVGREGRVPSPS